MEQQHNNGSSQASQMTRYGALQNGSQQTAVSLSERYKEVTTIAQAFNLKEAPLAKIEGDVKGSIMMHLSALSRFLGLKATLTMEHIEFIADKILSDEYYKWLKPADLKIFFDRIKTGKYGDFYGNLNSISFFQSLDKYMIERNGEIERLREQEAKQKRDEMKEIRMPYFVNKEGRLEWTAAEKQRQADEQRRKEEIEAENRRKREVAAQYYQQQNQ